MPGGSRRRVDDLLAGKLATGATIAEAAKAAGVSEATVYRRLKEPEFVAALDDHRAALLGTIRRRLTSEAVAATQTLTELARSAQSESVRLRAATSIVELALNSRRGPRSYSERDFVDMAEAFYDAALRYIPEETQPLYAAAMEQLIDAH